MTGKIARMMGAALLVLVAGMVAPAGACTVPQNAAALRAEIVAGVNAQRQRAGLPALAVSPRLDRVAQALACDNATRNRMSHTDAAGRDLRARLRAGDFRFRYANENITTRRSAAAAIEAWMGSAQHRDNIRSTAAQQVGAGVARAASGQTYWVMISGTAR